ncbi:MAG: Repressor LexA [candidate division WS6 bacterium 34_10]|uniref:Repressor LexA n=1 Tax=candidate division WS6 bacterium 34_10 TaxID=1641389 RepID=A0A101HHW8_9BACT|nr:MAG: Repressor LexA [candidate division WS6 bacterium 34_10]KUK77606.1 MAG: Repressor LexA [candidate division WS6 bacterium 34_10]
MADKLTQRQEQVLTLIRDFFLENGQAPSLGELQDMLGFSSKRGVVNHLIALENKGYIFRSSEPRGIKLLDETDDSNIEYEYLIGIPIFGYANAGTPLVMAEEEALGMLKVDKNLIGKKVEKDLFALIVKGDSMNERDLDGIKVEEGKYLIVDKEAEVQDGDVVVAVIDNSATVKNISLNTKDMVVLYPESNNPKHQPIYIDSNSDFLINGKVVKVLDNPMRVT